MPLQTIVAIINPKIPSGFTNKKSNNMFNIAAITNIILYSEKQPNAFLVI